MKNINPFYLSSCKDIVVYGSNLGSTVNFKNLSFKIRKEIFLTPYVYSILVGQLLSDGWLEKN